MKTLNDYLILYAKNILNMQICVKQERFEDACIFRDAKNRIEEQIKETFPIQYINLEKDCHEDKNIPS